MPKARYQVVDEQLEDQQMPSQVFAQSDDVVELLNELPALKATYSIDSLIVIDTWIREDGRTKAPEGE
jgi:hypothetical protein